MNKDKLVNSFLSRMDSCKAPLLLGLSGGPDSMALFHLLEEHSIPFESAHIDHGWREESAQEADFLKQMCEKKGIPFYLKKLNMAKDEKNLEDKGRNERLGFFKEICKERNLPGVLLAHHADDQAETVLKRLFEGATLPKLKGLCFKSEIYGLTLYRPLIDIKKESLLKWLEERGGTYFKDVTNEESRFLRSRLRCSLLPSLSQTFGKEVSGGLCRIGESAAELGEFLETFLVEFRKQTKEEEEGVSIDLSTYFPEPAFLLKAVIRDFFEQRSITLTASLVETIALHLKRGSCHKAIRVGTRKVKIHRRQITINNRIEPRLSGYSQETA